MVRLQVEYASPVWSLYTKKRHSCGRDGSEKGYLFDSQLMYIHTLLAKMLRNSCNNST